LRLAQAACCVGLAYAAVSVYWAQGGTWLLDTVGGTLEQQGRAGNAGIILAVCAAAVLKVIGAIVPLAAVGVTSGQATIAGRRRMRVQVRVLAWLEAAILTIYGLVLTVVGLLVQSGAIAPAASADHRALAWHAYLWDPWFLLWGALVAAALARSRQPGAAPAPPQFRTQHSVLGVLRLDHSPQPRDQVTLPASRPGRTRGHQPGKLVAANPEKTRPPNRIS
jgi:hypothetical protein